MGSWGRGSTYWARLFESAVENDDAGDGIRLDMIVRGRCQKVYVLTEALHGFAEVHDMY